MRVEPDGTVLVTTPRFTPKKIISRFVKEHQDWITAEKNRHQSKPQPITQDEVLIFGKKYTKVLRYSNQVPVGIKIVGDKLILNPTEISSVWGRSENNLLKNYLKHTAERYILPRTAQFGEKMDIAYGAITLREQKTRWGSCSSKGNLNFNWRLVHYLPEIIDYVIIHELAHRQHMNHSRQFWQLVATHDPAYRVHRGFLKRQGMSLG